MQDANWTYHSIKSTALGLATVVALAIAASAVHATEISDARPAGHRGEWADPAEAVAPTRTAKRAIGMSMMVNRTHFKTDRPTMAQMYRQVCTDALARKRKSLCQRWPEAKKSFEAAAYALGIPAPALVCLMKAETDLISGQTSERDAAGLTQFMPATARSFASLMGRNEYFQEAWQAFRDAGGTQRRVGAFTASNILSPNMDFFDVQIFASAMYLRRTLQPQGIQSFWGQHLGERNSVNGNSLRKLYHSLLIAYNWSPDNANDFLFSGSTDYRRIPRATKDYIRKFDACMTGAAKK